MDGFVARRPSAGWRRLRRRRTMPVCSFGAAHPDVMGYHDAREIPNYWAYAQNFVLQDHMFEPIASWSLPAHLFMVSEWSARCCRSGDPMSCVNAIENPARPAARAAEPDRPQARLRLDRPHVPAAQATACRWALLRRREGTEPDCDDGAHDLPAGQAERGTPGIWNPLPCFDTVQQDDQLGNIEPMHELLRRRQARARCRRSRGSTPTSTFSEHPPALVSAGQAYVTGRDQRRHAGPATGTRPRSSSPGTTGAASTTTSRRRRSTRTATACASRAW